MVITIPVGLFMIGLGLRQAFMAPVKIVRDLIKGPVYEHGYVNSKREETDEGTVNYFLQLRPHEFRYQTRQGKYEIQIGKSSYQWVANEDEIIAKIWRWIRRVIEAGKTA